MKNVRFLAILNFLALAIHISLSFATQFKWVNNLDVAQVSNQFPTLFTPAGITFSIWGVIYVALLAMCIYHMVISFTKNEYHEDNRAVSKMGWWFFVNNLATAAWLYLWTHQMIGTAAILIFIQLISLIIIHSLLGIQEPENSLTNKILTQAPLSIYLGWISIATIANTAAYLTSIKWSGWGVDHSTWTLLMIGLAIFVTMMMIFFRNNVLFGVVAMWALYGIIIKQGELQDYHPAIINAAWIGIAFTGAAIFIQAFLMHQYHPEEHHVIGTRFTPGKDPVKSI